MPPMSSPPFEARNHAGSGLTLSVKGSYVRSHFKAIEKAAHLRSNADVMKAIAIRAKRDVLDGGNKEILKELKNIAAIS